MMDRKAEYERIGRERDEGERESRRIMWSEIGRTLAEVVASCAAGLVVMFFAFWVSDPVLGKAFLWGGQAVGYAGMAYALLSGYRRGVERGDW